MKKQFVMLLLAFLCGGLLVQSQTQNALNLEDHLKYPSFEAYTIDIDFDALAVPVATQTTPVYLSGTYSINNGYLMPVGNTTLQASAWEREAVFRHNFYNYYAIESCLDALWFEDIYVPNIGDNAGPVIMLGW